MKKLVAEIYRIFKKARFRIFIILLMDIAETVIWASNPYIIGVCIDDLLDHRYFWLYIFIALQLLLIALHATNKFLDTRVYSKIVEEESAAYYEKIIQTNADESKISLLLDLVDEIPNFLETNLFEMISMVGGIVFALVFIFFTSGLFVFILAISISVVVPIATYRIRNDIALNNEKRKNIDEGQINIIASRNVTKYKRYINKVLSLDITNSDLDAKAYLITDLLQTLLLVIAIFSTIYIGNYTSGQLFSTITYVMMLNEYVGEINDVFIIVKNLKNTIDRLERNTK